MNSTASLGRTAACRDPAGTSSPYKVLCAVWPGTHPTCPGCGSCNPLPAPAWALRRGWSHWGRTTCWMLWLSSFDPEADLLPCLSLMLCARLPPALQTHVLLLGAAVEFPPGLSISLWSAPLELLLKSSIWSWRSVESITGTNGFIS